MTRFQIDFKSVISDYPEIVEEFMNNLRNSNSPYKEIDISNIKWYYTWDFDYENIEASMETSRFDMKYEERFQYELGKVRINVTMKAGQFKRRDRASTSVVPIQVIKVIDEIVKIMMIEEQKFFDNDEVAKSIPPIDKSMYETGEYNLYGAYKDAYLFDNDYESDEEYFLEEEDIDYDLDTILDKINELGLDSLTKGEKSFLDNHSKS